MRDAKLVVVQSLGNEIEAEIAKGALESAGISAMIQSDTAGRMREHLAWSGAGFKILVREEDVDAARKILAPQPQLVDDSDDDDDNADRPPGWRSFT